MSDRKLRRASPATSAPSISSTPKTASGASRASATAIGGAPGGTVADTARRFSYPASADAARLHVLDRRRGASRPLRPRRRRRRRRDPALHGLGGAHRRRRPRTAAGRPRPRRPPGGARSRGAPATPAGRAAGSPGPGRPCGCRASSTRARSPRTTPAACAATGSSFTGPTTPRGFRWLIDFESVRRKATVFLNGRRLGSNADPYTPFAVDARGLRPGAHEPAGRRRRQPQGPATCPRAGGTGAASSARSTSIPAGRAHLRDLGTMSDVTLPRAGARAAAPSCCSTACSSAAGARADRPTPRGAAALAVGPGDHAQTFRLPRQTRPAPARAPVACRSRAPQLWSPEDPQLYSARITLRDRGAVQQVDRRSVGLRSVKVKHGHALPEQPAHRAAPAPRSTRTCRATARRSPRRDMDRIVARPEGARRQRHARPLPAQRGPAEAPRPGRASWSGTRRRSGSATAARTCCWQPLQRQRAWETVQRTVIAARSHPSVITHSVANELWFAPRRPARHANRFLDRARRRSPRDLDPTLPISVDINGRPGPRRAVHLPAASTCSASTSTSAGTAGSRTSTTWPLYLQEMRDLIRSSALVMTEFGRRGAARARRRPGHA